MTLLAAKQFRKIWVSEGQKHRLSVLVELKKLGQNQKAHFSIVGDYEYQAKNNRWLLISAGAIHKEIAKRMPELKPFLLVHLADENGVPMHAYENAAYWAGQTKSKKFDLATLAAHLRVEQPIALDMLDYIAHYWGELDTITTPTMAWKDACERFSLPFQWQQEADKARGMLNQIAQLEEAQ